MPKTIEDLPLPCFSYLGVSVPPNYNYTSGTGGPPAGADTGGMGGPPAGADTGGMGGPPAGAGTNYTSAADARTAALNAASAAASANIPKIGLTDMCYMPKADVEFTVLAFIIIYYFPTLYLYIKNRHHILIKYRQPNIVITQSILGIIMSILVPINRYFEISCLLNTWIINPIIFCRSILTYSRYVRHYYMQKLSIFKLKFGANKNKDRAKFKDEPSKTSLIRPGDSTIDVIDETRFSVATSAKGSSISNELTGDITGIGDPILYFKKLDKIINKKLFLIMVICPTIFIIGYSIVVTIIRWDTMKEACPNEDKSVGTPKMILCMTIIFTSFFLLYQAYIKQKWDSEIKIEFTLFILAIVISTIMLQLTVREYTTDGLLEYRTYISYVMALFLHGLTVIEPLVRVYISKFTSNNKEKLSEEEFLERFNNKMFKAQIVEIATNTFCIENVLFFDAHCDLMNMVINFYGKKGTLVPNKSASYSCSDTIHKNTLNQYLYKPFNDVFRPQFEQVYNLYINEEGIACVNVKASTIRTIKEQMENNEYSYLMFNQAAEEIANLLYTNIYPRMKNL